MNNLPKANPAPPPNEDSALTRFLQILDDGDPCSIGVAILILLWFGHFLADPRQRRQGIGLAGVAFLAFGAFRYSVMPPDSGEDLQRLALRSLLAAGLILGLAWIVLPLGSGCFQFLRSFLFLPIVQRWNSILGWVAERKRRRADDDRLRRAQEAYDRAAPDRERQRQEADARARMETQAQKRRDEARARAELFFALHSPELGDRFPKADFEDFKSRYLGDQRAPEYVEQRAQQLIEIIQQHLEKVSPSQKADINDLIAAFERQCATLAASPLDEEVKQSLLWTLREQLFDRLKKNLENP